ncbi:MAG: hypothetical protein HFH72_16795 [Lachnospiraceae bacterium]|nr:hypothetical protein [Lachnospiraceae bacterium]
MPRKKSQSSGNKPLPANQQKGKKVCTCCHEEKNLTDFYYSSSPMYSLDERIPVCKECCKTSVLSEDGRIDFDKFKDLLRNIDKPLYFDLLFSSEESVKKENSYLSDEEVSLHGYEILQKYFTLVAMRQDKAKSYSDAEKEGFIHQNSNRTKKEKDEILNRYSHLINQYSKPNKTVHAQQMFKNNKDNEIINIEDKEFEVTQDMIDMFGEGYTRLEYRKMLKKYNDMTKTYVIQTNLHKEALLTYVRFKVKEEMATAKGDVQEAQKWYQAAQDAAEKAKITPRQLSKEDLQGGITSFSEIFKAVEQAVDVIPILPRFKYRPNDALDFNIWCYINYARDLQGLPQCEYEDVYKFYDKKKQEYLEQYGDPYGIFDDDPSEELRDNIKKFITLPKDYEDGDE